MVAYIRAKRPPADAPKFSESPRKAQRGLEEVRAKNRHHDGINRANKRDSNRLSRYFLPIARF